MANFVQDLSQGYILGGSLFGTTTAVTTNTLAAGNSVDCSLAVGCMMTLVQIVGAVAGTANPTLFTKAQESTDGTTWTDCSTSAGTMSTATTSNTVQSVPYLATKRYQRSTSTVTGTNPVFCAETLIVAPLHIAPSTDTGFSNTAAAANAG